MVLRFFKPFVFGLSLDVPGCRWTGHEDGGARLPSFSFGPKSGDDRLTALEGLLNMMWASYGPPRPECTMVLNWPLDELPDVLRQRDVEALRKYSKK